MSSGPLPPPTIDVAADDRRPPVETGADSIEPPARAEPGTQSPGPPLAAERCLNCDVGLTGRYCASCGQDSQRNVGSLRQTVGELLEDLSQADARVWRTLRLLATRPGELTCEYLRGKRASYTPPLRLYVALSLLVFVVALLPEGSALNVRITSQGIGPVSLSPTATAALEGALQKIDEAYRQVLREQVAATVAKEPAARQVGAIAELVAACGEGPLGLAALNKGVEEDLPYEQVVVNCRKVAAPSQKLLNDGAEYAPKMMVFFLPLIALFGKLLYLGSRRHYIGHLIFFVHFHAFVFLASAAGNLAGSLAVLSGVKWLKDISELVAFGLIIWVPIYLYKAMRRVYGQGRWVTRLKFMLLGAGYLINFIVSILLLAVFVALQNDVDWKDGLDAMELTFK